MNQGYGVLYAALSCHNDAVPGYRPQKCRAQILSKDINFAPFDAQRRDKQKNFV
jgi:hypothetical protein